MDSWGPDEPRRIGSYRLLARLGAGGMGQVYLARSDRGRTVAVKLVRRELAERGEFRARFRQEVEAARRVGGRWTAPVLDADTEAPVPWVATGYIAGPSLLDVVSTEHGPLPDRTVRILAAGLAQALSDIHAAGLVHRDLKPSNVLVTIDGPRVIDFGIARALDAATEGGLTRTGAVIGSPGFMSPEQVLGRPVTPACDIFCLGSVLAFAATGRFPFGDSDVGSHALMYRVAREEPDLSGVPDGLTDLVRDCLRKDPAARPLPRDILRRTDAGQTLGDGRLREPWLPAALVAQLGRHAVQLLDREDAAPDGGGGGDGGPDPATGGGGGGGGVSGDPAESAEAKAATAAAASDPSSAPAPAAPSAPAGPSVAATPSALPATPAQYGPATYPGPAAPQPAPSPHPAYGYGPTHPYGHTTPYGTAPPPAAPPARTGRHWTLPLAAAALTVAALAGVAVYVGIASDDDRRSSAGTDDNRSGSLETGDSAGTTSPDPSPDASGEAKGDTSKDPQDPEETPKEPSATGDVPDRYLGTWQASFDTAEGTNTRVLTLSRGKLGEQVMTLVGRGPGHDCRWSATLRSAGPPLELGPSAVTQGNPTACSPGQWSRLTMQGDSTLVRELVGSGGTPLTYRKVR
ncbi:serine/threonine-protein kinase [Streptomyces sp. 549]|uniref:serine/threonine-protein kinase n=1 Tax=Streptomyces sp. 549 TaxID=3049076 RepID=UPI0024C227D0|nr:serine/threonine-protein kinase [Streptomyces sp. 549]MDK1472452.1 serine/threonine-protein kinase [Streptomyces sp. 549]